MCALLALYKWQAKSVWETVELLIAVRCCFTTEGEPFRSFQLSPGIHQVNFTAGIDGCGWTDEWKQRKGSDCYGFQQSSFSSWPTKFRDLERACKYSFGWYFELWLIKGSKTGLQGDCVGMSVTQPNDAHRFVRRACASMLTQSCTWDMLFVRKCLFRHVIPVFTFIRVFCRVGLMHAHMSRTQRALGLEAQGGLRWSLFSFYASSVWHVFFSWLLPDRWWRQPSAS